MFDILSDKVLCSKSRTLLEFSILAPSSSPCLPMCRPYSKQIKLHWEWLEWALIEHEWLSLVDCHTIDRFSHEPNNDSHQHFYCQIFKQDSIVTIIQGWFFKVNFIDCWLFVWLHSMIAWMPKMKKSHQHSLICRLQYSDQTHWVRDYLISFDVNS